MNDCSIPPKSFNVTIIGGGLAGLVLAIGLSRRGIPVKIYEAASAFTETSAGIGFGPNAVRAMSLLDPRIRTAFESLKTENGWKAKKNTWFDFRVGWGSVPELVTELKMGDYDEGGGNVLRARFMEHLVELLPDGCATFGKTLSAMEQNEDHVRLFFQDGTEVVSHAVVGCDGIRSTVRKCVLKNDTTSQAVFSGVYGYRGLVDMRTAISAVGEELAMNSQVYIGKDGDIVTYPIEEASVLNVVAFRKYNFDTWSHSRWIIDGSVSEMMEDYEGWGEIPTRILQQIQKPQIWAIFDMPPTPSYAFGNITLLGDAAHASTSHAGAGAGMAVEDALVLCELLADPHVHPLNDISQIFSAYDAVRRPRTQRLVQHSRESAMLFQMRHAGVGDDLEKLKQNLQVRQKWIWEMNMNEHLEEARAELVKALSDLRT